MFKSIRKLYALRDKDFAGQATQEEQNELRDLLKKFENKDLVKLQLLAIERINLGQDAAINHIEDLRQTIEDLRQHRDIPPSVYNKLHVKLEKIHCALVTEQDLETQNENHDHAVG